MAADSRSFLSALREGFEKARSDVRCGFLLAVSGGADSVALLHGTLQLWQDQSDRIVVAHVNHGLRGSEGDADARFVSRLAGELGLRCESLAVEPGRLEKDSAGSLEEAARNVRYEFLTQTAARLEFASVVTAHHLDDQAETILHNIIRGTGLRGLGGMRASRELSDSVVLVRPMLSVSQSKIDRFVAAGGHEFRHDSSNQEVRFTRNRLRSRLLPILKSEFNVRVAENLVSLASHAAEARAGLDALGRRILEEAVIDRQPQVCRLNRTMLAAWPAEIVRHTLTVLWIEQQWPRRKMAFRHWEALAGGVLGDGDYRADFPGHVEVVAQGDLIRMTVIPRGIASNDGPQGQNPGEIELT